MICIRYLLGILTAIDNTASPTTTPISTIEKPDIEKKNALIESIKQNIVILSLIISIMTFLFGTGIIRGKLERYELEKREKDALKSRLTEFISFWRTSDRLTMSNKQKELNKRGNKINDLKIEKLPQDIVDKIYHIKDEILELSETAIYNDEGESKKERVM